MIKANELRIGNYIFYRGEILEEVSSIFCEDLFDRINDLDESNYDAIPLTEEWLMKLGFDIIRTLEKGANPILGIFVTSISLKTVPNFKITFSGSLEYEVGVKYVHQLQNLVFVMTGEELTIKS